MRITVSREYLVEVLVEQARALAKTIESLDALQALVRFDMDFFRTL